MKRIFVLATAAVAVIAAAGRAALGRQAFADPIVSLRDVKITGLGLQGGNLEVVLAEYNPNNYSLDATRLNYRIQVDSTPLANGVLDNRFSLTNKDTTQVHIPVTFSWTGLGAGVRSIFNTGAVNYRVLGDVTVGSPVGSYTIPFSQTGRYSTLSR